MWTYQNIMNKVVWDLRPRVIQQESVNEWRPMRSNTLAVTEWHLGQVSRPASYNNDTASPWNEVSEGGTLPVPNVHALGDMLPTRRVIASYGNVEGIDRDLAYEQVEPGIRCCFYPVPR